jgi:hypothetical protein
MKTYILQHNTFTHNKGDKFTLENGILTDEKHTVKYYTTNILNFNYWFKEEKPVYTEEQKREMIQFAARCVDAHIAARKVEYYDEFEKYINRV